MLQEIIQKNKKSVYGIAVFFVIIVGILICVLIAHFIIKTQFIGSGAQERATITVAGTGKLDAIPDVAKLSFTISNTDASMAKAQRTVSDSVSALTEAVLQEGVQKESITTRSYTSFPEYEYPEMVCMAIGCPRPGNPVLKGYKVSHTLEITIENLDSVERVLARIGEFGVENLTGPEFAYSDQEALEREVTEQAIHDAKEKAKSLARDLDTRIIRVVGYSDSQAGVGSDLQFRSAAAPSMEKVSLPVGEQKLEKTVFVTYEIR